MDLIAWAVGLVAGFWLPSVNRALVVAALSSIAVTSYQYFLTDPQVWEGKFPADWIGATAMVAISCLAAYVGSIFRTRRERRRGGQEVAA